MFKIKILVFCLIYFATLAVSESATLDMQKYVGTWGFIKYKDESKNKACADKIIIKNLGKDKIRLTYIKRDVTVKYMFQKGKTIRGKHEMEYKKDKFPELDESHTVKTIYNTAIVNGNLSISWLWSNPKLDILAAGIRVFSINKNGTLSLEK